MKEVLPTDVLSAVQSFTLEPAVFTAHVAMVSRSVTPRYGVPSVETQKMSVLQKLFQICSTKPSKP